MYDVRCRRDNVLLLHNPRCRLVITFLLALLLYALVCKCSKRKQYKQLSGIQDLLNFCMIICVKSKSGKFVLQNYCMLYCVNAKSRKSVYTELCSLLRDYCMCNCRLCRCTSCAI